MRLVKFTNTNQREIWINPDHVMDVYDDHGSTTRIALAVDWAVSVREDISAVVRQLTNENPVDEPAEPVVLSLVCKNCHRGQEGHKINWAGSLNCPLVINHRQMSFEPEIRKD